MKTKILRKVSIQLAFVIGLGAILFFQNCQPGSSFFQTKNFEGKTGFGIGAGSVPVGAGASEFDGNSGNGDPYLGKPGTYLHTKKSNPCKRRNLLGEPFPTHQIDVRSNGIFQVRKDCIDIFPVQLSSAEVIFGASGIELSFGGLSYNFYSDISSFNLAKPHCPNGSSINSNSPNLFVSGMNFLNSPWTSVAANLFSADWFGALEILPKYQLLRSAVSDSSLFQRPHLERGKNYTLSVLMEAGNQAHAIVSISDKSNPGKKLLVQVDFLQGIAWVVQSGAATQGAQGGAVGAEISWVSAIRYGRGLQVLVHFRTSNGFGGISPNGSVFPQVGFGPLGTSPGDYIVVTAADLRDLSSYCPVQTPSVPGSTQGSAGGVISGGDVGTDPFPASNGTGDAGVGDGASGPAGGDGPSGSSDSGADGGVGSSGEGEGF